MTHLKSSVRDGFAHPVNHGRVLRRLAALVAHAGEGITATGEWVNTLSAKLGRDGNHRGARIASMQDEQSESF
jgi:hypothetical protein